MTNGWGIRMFYQVQLWKGISSPYMSAHQLHKAETYKGIWLRTIFVIIIGCLLTGISAYFGHGNEGLSKLIYSTSSSEFETIKGLFALGQVVQSLVVLITLVFLPALILWLFTDLEYKKLLVIQIFVTCITLMEKVITLPLLIYLRIDAASSPFTLGVIAQYLTNYKIIINFFGEISLFSIWAMTLQYTFLHILTKKNPKILILLIVTINLFIWLFTALFSYIKFDVLF